MASFWLLLVLLGDSCLVSHTTSELSTAADSDGDGDDYLPLSPNCTDEQAVFYADVFSQAWLSRIVVVGTPFEVLASNNDSYFLRVYVNRILKGSQQELPLLYNSRNRIPVFVRVSPVDSETFLDIRCADFRDGRLFSVPSNASQVVKLSQKYIFFLDTTADPTMFTPAFSPVERKRQIESGISQLLQCNSTACPSDFAPKLKVESNVIGRVGGSVSVACESEDLVQSHIQWLRALSVDEVAEWEVIQTSGTEPFRVRAAGGEGSGLLLTINPLEYKHSGLYRCTARSLFGQSDAEINLQVLSWAEYDKRAPPTSTSTTKLVTARILVAEEDLDDEPIVATEAPRNCSVAPNHCKTGYECRRNPKTQQSECVCASAFLCALSGVRSSSASSVFRAGYASTLALWPLGTSTPFAVATYDRQILSSVAMRYALAIGSILLLVGALSIVVLYAWRFKRSDRQSRPKTANQLLGSTQAGETTLETTVNMTCTTSLSNTNSSGSACGSTSSSSAASQKSANCVTLSPRLAKPANFAGQSLQNANAAGKRPVQFDFEDDDGKSPCSDVEMCLATKLPTNGSSSLPSTRRSAYKRPDSNSRLKAHRANVTLVAEDCKQVRDVYVSLSMPSEARSFSSQALSSTFARINGDCNSVSQRIAQSRSLHVLPPRNTVNARLWPVQEIPSDQDDPENDRLHATAQTCSLDRRRLLSRGHSQDDDCGKKLHVTYVSTPKSPSQGSTRSCGGVIRNPSAFHKRNPNLFLTEEIQIEHHRPAHMNVTFTNPSTFTINRPY